MLFGDKNDGGIELHLTPREREMLFNAMCHYKAKIKDYELGRTAMQIIRALSNGSFLNYRLWHQIKAEEE